VSHIHATDNTYYFTSHSYPWSQSMDILDQVDSIENEVEAEQLKYVYIKSFLFLYTRYCMLQNVIKYITLLYYTTTIYYTTTQL
jgi:hypothetical protein